MKKKIKKLRVWRQGDIAIIAYNGKIEDADFELANRPVLADGEVTGHAHRVDPDKVDVMIAKAFKTAMSYAKAQMLIVQLDKDGGNVSHEEHEDLVDLPQNGEVIRQREFDWATKMIRRVQD